MSPPDQWRPRRAVPLVSVLALLAIGSSAALEPVGVVAAGEPGATVSKKGKKKQRKYPPARLWYRVELSFTGNLNYLPAADVSRDSEWVLRSNTAVRVTMLCVNRKRTDDPGFWNSVKVKGRNGRIRQMRVGGCAALKGKHPNLRNTLRFEANAAGEVTGWENVENRNETNCEPRSAVQTLISPQPLRGKLATRSSATHGFTFASNVAGPSGTDIDVVIESTTCEGSKGPFTVNGEEKTRPFVPTDHIGFESVIDSRPTAESMRFSVNARKFGSAMSFDFGPLSQVYDLTRPAPLGSGQSPWDKVYSYRLKLIPCPNGGRNVAAC